MTAAGVSEDESLIAESRVRRVLERYCALLDFGAGDELIDLFDGDCSVTMMGRTFEGRAALEPVWGQLSRTDRPGTLHVLINPQIRVDGGSATAVSGWAMIDRSGADGHTVVSLAGHYHDTLRRGPDGAWRFTARRVQTLARPANVSSTA
ncbi:hypothetical protein BN1232_01641 [Mycobacterium lentiflavum]|uniref:SnoaL-like domain-containing protein n=1 Tax=Mycobacterium lentiflavum TaxID=141349 RepID=A0A0E4CMD5_MYCLN|nr:nuclear transport factor 2 family protein [Mycobacterium lentiflavum]CQD09042.1 hypothetical protein BN1232_01641 [Mycobacterium lentiflavum]